MLESFEEFINENRESIFGFEVPYDIIERFVGQDYEIAYSNDKLKGSHMKNVNIKNLRNFNWSISIDTKTIPIVRRQDVELLGFPSDVPGSVADVKVLVFREGRDIALVYPTEKQHRINTRKKLNNKDEATKAKKDFRKTSYSPPSPSNDGYGEPYPEPDDTYRDDGRDHYSY